MLSHLLEVDLLKRPVATVRLEYWGCFPLRESLLVNKWRRGPDGTYRDAVSSIGVVSMFPLVCEYYHLDVAECDAHGRTHVSSW